MQRTEGDKFYDYSKKFLLAGCSSSARWNENFSRPLYFKKASGPYIYDLDNNKIIDMFCSHGASILGYNHENINNAIKNAIDMGIMCSYETEYQTALAEMLCKIIPCAEVCRFTCSGTEAVMHLIRLAREYTGKDLIMKFEGHYHGLVDYIQYSWSSDSLEEMGPYNNPNPVPFSEGIPEGIKKYLKVIPFNNIKILEETVEKLKSSLAAIILEPINYNQGCIIPDPEFLKALRKITEENNIILIFDEVLSAFRTGPGCAQEYFNITPDTCTIGKSIGGGTPISVIAGKRIIMEHFKPIGKCTHSGTYNGHLIPVMASIATLEEISKRDFYSHIYELADKLYGGLNEIFNGTNLNIKIQGLGARFGLYFDVKKNVIRECRDLIKNNNEMAMKFYKSMYQKGIYFHGLHHGFSSQHSMKDITKVLDCAKKTVKELERIY